MILGAGARGVGCFGSLLRGFGRALEVDITVPQVAFEAVNNLKGRVLLMKYWPEQLFYSGFLLQGSLDHQAFRRLQIDLSPEVAAIQKPAQLLNISW